MTEVETAAEPVAKDRRFLDLPAPRPDFEYPLTVAYCGGTLLLRLRCVYIDN